MIVPPYNDEQIIAGQGTTGLEILQDSPDVDLVLVPTGGGGLISGVSAALKLSGSKAKIVGVEPELANDAQQSFRMGEIVELPAERVSSTLADGLRTQSVGPINFEHIRRFVDDMIAVSEDEIRAAMRHMVMNAHLVAEPSGAVTFAAWLFHPKRTAGIEEDGRGGQRRQRRSAIAGAGAGNRLMSPARRMNRQMIMRAAVLITSAPITQQPLRIEDVPRPEVMPGHVLLKVRACGVCRTDLHIVEGELAPRLEHVVPGHQIVGDVVEGASAELPKGTRVGVSWIGGTDGTCWYCRHAMENLCDAPTFTGYTVNGGYAEYAIARADFVFPLPAAARRSSRGAIVVRGHHRLP